MKLVDGFEKRPLVHVQVSQIASNIRKKFPSLNISEFWHLPKNAVFENTDAHGVYDWLLAECVISNAKMYDHRPLVAINYKSGSGFKIWDKTEDYRLVVVTVGAEDCPDFVAEKVWEEYELRENSSVCAQFLKIPQYQLKIMKALEGSDLIPLQEVALSEIGSVTDDVKYSISEALPKKLNLDSVPGRRRFDVVICTKPPMCFALAALEIDGSTHQEVSLGDLLKDEFCKKIGLPLIRIQIGEHLGKELNERQDTFLPLYIGCLYQAIRAPNYDIATLPDFLSNLSKIAEKANSEIRKDLQALISHSGELFSRLSKFSSEFIPPNVPAMSQPSIGELRYGLDFGPCVVKTEATCKRNKDDLFVNISSVWGEAVGEIKNPALPRHSQVGPLRIRVIADRGFRERFYYYLESSIRAEHWRKHNADGLEALGIEDEHDFHSRVLEWQLLDDLAQAEGDFDRIYSLMKRVLTDLPKGNWDEVWWDPDEFVLGDNRKPEGLWGEPTGDCWYRASEEACAKFWNARRAGFGKSKRALVEALNSRVQPISSTLRESFDLIISEHDDVWSEWDSRK